MARFSGKVLAKFLKTQKFFGTLWAKSKDMKTDKQIAAAAAEFAKRWRDRSYEKGDAQPFWLELLEKVFGIDLPASYITFEEKVKVEATNFIDAHIPATHVLIEQKSGDVDLRKALRQSDGSYLSPYEQARKYSSHLKYSERPRWIVTCNFHEFHIYDMEKNDDTADVVLLKNLGKEYYRLKFLVDAKNEHIRKEMKVSEEAGEIVARIYDALLTQYDDNSPEALRCLNILCVRLVFCLYAEDAGVFSHDQFHDYLVRYDAEDLRNALMRLFEVLNTPNDKRSKYLKDDLKAFPYTNGGLFAHEIEIPQFTEELKQTLLQNASLDFDWSEISPTIFGALFESTLNPETRRNGGMHYTSIENIHKVIDPLFLNDLRKEFNEILEDKVDRQRKRRLAKFQEKLGSLTFLDPACGSGNFLTETYLSLRRLENAAIRERCPLQLELGESPIKVNINQFYGIEINDFAVTVAATALWIAEAQMMQETEQIIKSDIDFLPLKHYANIVEGNALRTDWATLMPDIPNNDGPLFDSFTVQPDGTRHNYDYIIGNPPFVGQKLQSESQKADLLYVFGKNHKGVKMLDYVAGWYKKAYDIVRKSKTRVALVSTNSICQGEAVEDLWSLILKDGIHIDFAYRTFRWDSEAILKAHVHCVIVGFSAVNIPKIIYDNERIIAANNINGYLIDAPDIFITRRGKPICQALDMTKGAQLIDGGGFMLESEEEKSSFIKLYPEAAPYVYRYYNAKDFLNNSPAKYCLYLKNCPPSLLKTCKGIYDKVKSVYEYRINSDAKTTRILADTPWLFFQSQVPEKQSIIIPVVSSENREYIPMCFMPVGNVYTNALFYIDDADIYDFGVLESCVHMAWTRAVCGRLEMRYRYSNDIVYNNFPWPAPTDEQKAKIEQTAQAILDARALHPDTALSVLYDKFTMPKELRKAHQENDRAVMEAYGFNEEMTESQYVAELFKLYQKLTK